MKLFRFPIVLKKTMHNEVVRVRGSRNAADYPIGNGDTYEAGALVLNGFVGKFNSADGKYTGWLECRLTQPSDEERDLIDFQSLHGDDPVDDAVAPATDTKKKSSAKKKSTNN